MSQRIARTATWLMVGRTITAASGLLVTPILARRLSPTDYGFFKQVDLAAALIGPFLILGMDKSITYFVPRKDRDPAMEVTAPVTGLLMASLLVVLVAALLPSTFSRVFGIGSSPLLVITAAVYAVAAGLTTVAARGLIAAGSPGAASLIPPAVGVPRSLALFAVALFMPRLDTLLIVILAFAGIQIGAWLLALARKRLLRPPPRRAVIERHLRYSSLLAFGSLAQTWGQRLDRYLVSSTLSPASYAVYANGQVRIPFIPIMMAALRDATAPRYSQLESKNRYAEMASLWRAGTEITLPIGILVSTFLSLTAKWSIPLYFGPTYVDSVPIFQVFAFSILISSLVGIEPILRALAALRFLVVTILISLSIRIVAGLATLKYGSLVDLVAVQLVITAIFLVVRLAYIRGRLGVSWLALLPLRGLRVTLPLCGLGIALNLVTDRTLGQQPVWALLVATGTWGLLVLGAMWWQGTVQSILTSIGVRRRSR